jgi:hypothetical protein
MLRKLVDYKKLDHELAALLIETYPDGYGDDDIISFRNAQGDFVEAVEIQTPETLYLVKISQSLANFISNFEDTIVKELDLKDEAILEEAEATDFESELNSEKEVEGESESD